MEAKKINIDHEKPTIHYTKRGGLYADPKDILTSGNAQRQLAFIRDSELLKKVQRHQKVK